MKATWLLALAALSCGGPPGGGGAVERISLIPGAVFHRELARGETHRFRFDAEADRYLRLIVEQRGPDVAVLLKDPADHLLYEVDGPNGAKGPEEVLAVTPAAGAYTLVVEPVDPKQQGAFDLIVREVRRPVGRDRLRVAASAAYARAERRRFSGEHAKAVPAYREAMRGFDALGDRGMVAQAQRRLGESLLGTGDLKEASAVLDTAAAWFRDREDGLNEARCLNPLGTARRRLGDPGGAIRAHDRALQLYRAAGNESGQAAALSDLGLALDRSGDLQAAVERYEAALVLWRKLGRGAAESVTLQNLGNLYILIGQDAEGMDLLRRALTLVEGGKASDRVPALIAMGWAHYLAGRPEVALGFYQEAIALSQRLGDRQAEAGAWDRRGSALRALRRYGEAADCYSRALAMSRAAGSPVNQAHSLANLGWLDLETGAVERARRRLGEAVELFRSSGELNGEAFARIGLSRADRRLGAFGPAREQIDEAIRRIEEVRAGLRGPMSRGSFLATRYDGYEELVILLLELHRREPEKGHAREALEVAERARARNLSEVMFGESPQEDRPAAARRRELQDEVRTLELRRQSLALQEPRSPRLTGLDAELRARNLELDRLEEPAGQRDAKTLSAAEIQDLAEDGTVFVVYLLAEPASFAWTVDRQSVEVHLLPGREQIERLARRVFAGLSQKSGVVGSADAWNRAVRELSQAVIAPLGRRIAGGQRLAILADGALHLVPFAALPEPGFATVDTASDPLVVRHEIVMLPSATFLARQRRRLADRRPAPGAVAVLADPIFSPDDERLPRGRRGSRSPDARGFQPAGPFPRLPFTAQEAEAILRFAAGKKTLVAEGAEADRDLATSGALGRYSIVHFAAHGLLHPVLPERSGILLSLYDGQGRHQDGFLSAPDVAALRLPAELVVLSACQTGLGRELRGEGLVGLTQAFFRAGARRVVVSHWNVQDRATAELMAVFYRGLLVERLAPAAALREAQLAIRGDGRWRSPYFWAGFSLQGDWR
ncbi:MAG TPA: CHAT domain-containing protein [Thermoanaerobaculia bacterium]|nr:CHAT domain-containing protein [Thermoanaerobaculia bacterium]